MREPDSLFSNLDEESPLPYEDFAHRSTGPRTPRGKARSSKNSVKHGCRSSIVVLPNENQEDFDNLYERWREAYQPDTEATLELLEQFVLNKWLLERNERRYSEVEQQLSNFPFTKWDDGQHKIFQLALRYKTAAERSASKAQRDLEDYLKNRRSEEKHREQLNEKARDNYLDMEKGIRHMERDLEDAIDSAAARGVNVSQQKATFTESKKRNRATLARVAESLPAAETKTRAQLIFRGQSSPKKLRKLQILEQWVEITIQDGVTTTQLTPSNEDLIARGQTMNPPPELVYRRLNFPHGIPDEYDWTTDDPSMKKYGGIGIQRMTIDTWLDVIDAEKLRAGSHIGPCGDPLPRPEERGGCDCPACTENRERLERRASSKPGVNQQPDARPNIEITEPELD